MPLTPQETLGQWLLAVLDANGGRASKWLALRLMDETYGHLLDPEDREVEPSVNEPKWENRTAWERNTMTKLGLLQTAEQSGRGVWALSPLGRETARTGRYERPQGRRRRRSAEAESGTNTQIERTATAAVRTIEVDQNTAEALDRAARASGSSPSEVVAKLVRQAGLDAAPPAAQTSSDTARVAIHVDYDGYRTKAWFSPTTCRVDIEEGPLSGQSFKSPSGAARAVVSRLNPRVDPNRNGWTFWTVTTSGQALRSLR